MLKYAVYLPNFGPYGSARTMANLARDAEEAGWDGFFMWDHLAGMGPADMVDPWIAMTAIATQTSRIRFGALVTPLPRRRPWKVARETVSLDRLSDGRLTVGVGLGVGPDEWDNLGEESNLKSRAAMLDEALDVLTGLWRGESFSYKGQFYQVKESCFKPTPAQSPRIPVWVAGFWPNKPPFRRAAKWDGIFPLPVNFEEKRHLTPDDVRELVTYIKQYRTSNAPFDVLQSGFSPGDKPDVATDMVGPYIDAGATWWIEQINPWRFNWGQREGPWPVEAMRERILQGPPKI